MQFHENMPPYHEMTPSTNKQLFQEFPSVDWNTWKAKAVTDLRDTPYERIMWTTPDGFTLEPWYASGNAVTLPGQQEPKQRNIWRNCRRIKVSDTGKANREALDSLLSQEVTALEFHLGAPQLCQNESLCELLQGINIPAAAIYFSGAVTDQVSLLETLATLPGFIENSGGLLSETPETLPEKENRLFSAADAMPGFRFLAVDTVPWHEQGATPSQEIALALAAASDLLNRFTSVDIEPGRIVGAMEIIMAAGSSHFTELAKPRAFRKLFRHIAAAYGAEKTLLPRLFARTSPRNLSLLDPFTNVLRQTTETVSAVLGGYDTLQITPFDGGLSVSESAAERISGNIHLILKEESCLHRVADPAAGSYYLETLTAELAKAAWNIFLELEAAGGFASAIQSGLVKQKITEGNTAKRKTLENRKKTLIGVNRYPWPLTPVQEKNIAALQQAIQSAPEGSETAGFERLRLKAETRRITSGFQPSVFIWLSGDPGISFRQAAFADDFFRCGGFAVTGMTQLDPDEKSCAKALENNPDIVVLCIAEKDPVPTAETICRTLCALKPGIIPVMAGKPPEQKELLLTAGLDSFIHTGVNVLDMLQSYHLKTGVQ